MNLTYKAAEHRGEGLHYFRLMLIAAVVALILPAHLVRAVPMTQGDHEKFLAAIEDYNFSDLDAAIPVFSVLHARYPENREVVRYLALALEEAKRLTEAERAYRDWLKLGGMRLSKEMREAWLGYARVLMAEGKQGIALDVLDQWTMAHPEDSEAAVIYGDLLTRKQKFAQAEQVWRKILARPDVQPVHQAAAHYYLALSAYRAGDFSRTREEAKAAIRAAPDSPYAPVARKLTEVRPVQRRPGWTGQLLLGEFYTSNVELLPDVVTPTGGKKKSDVFTEADLTLGYQGSNWRMGYALNSTWHARRNDFDLAVQSGFLDYDIGNWTITPRVEHVMLNRQMLYFGGGFDLAWMNAGWMVRYQGRYRRFSRSFGALKSDLGRLSGFSNELGLSRMWTINGNLFVVGGHLHQENTRGDATHQRTDDFTQAGLNLSWTGTWKHADVGLNAFGYLRRYAKADPAVLITGNEARKDSFIQLGGHLAWRIGGHADNRLVIQGHWQRNVSNYDPPKVLPQYGKSYREWQGGLSWQYLW